MIIKSGTGLSEKEDLLEAVKEAATIAQKKVGTKTPKLVMVTHTFNYPLDKGEALMEEIKKVFSPEVPVVGGSFFGIFVEEQCKDAYNSMGKQKGVGVLALDSDYLSIGLGVGLEAGKDPFLAGKEATQNALGNLNYNPSVAYTAMVSRGIKDITSIRPISGVYLTPGMINTEGGVAALFDDQIAKGIAAAGGRSIRVVGAGVTGGAPPAAKGFIEGNLYLNGKVYQRAVGAILFGSDLEIGYGVGTGFEFAKAGFFVTKVNGFMVEELNGKPAFPTLSEELKKHGVELKIGEPIYYAMAQKGLGLGLPEATENFFWPQIPMLSPDGKGILFNIFLNEGAPLSLVKTSKEACLNVIGDAVKGLLEDTRSEDLGFVFHSSCCFRGTILGADEYFKESERIKKEMDEKVSVFGVSSCGETSFHKTGRLTGAAYTFGIFGITNKLVSEE